MKFDKYKKTFFSTLVLVTLFHIAVININYSHTKKNMAKGALVHKIYLNPGPGGSASNSDAASLKKERQANPTTI